MSDSDLDTIPKSDEETSSSDSQDHSTVVDSDSDSSDDDIAPIGRRKNAIISDSDEDSELVEPKSRNFKADIFPKLHKGKSRSPAAIISDSEEDVEFGERALSPRTRMSITGIRPSDLSDNSSEIEYSTDDETQKNSFIDKSADTSNSHSTVFETDDEVESKFTNNKNRSTKSCEFKVSKNFEIEEEENTSPNAIKVQISPAVSISKDDDFNASSARYSTVFVNSIKADLSSTINQDYINKTSNALDESSNDSDVVEIKNESFVDIISSDDDLITMDIVKPGEIKPEFKKSVQTKITSALTTMASSSQTLASKKFVSQEFYDKEVKKLNDLKLELISAESLLEKLGRSLYDGGKQLSMRVDILKGSIKTQAKEIVNFVIEGNKQESGIEKAKKPFFDKSAPDWDDLSAAVNQIQPIFTGKRAINTFNKQKALTIERLKDLHGSLENCPTEDVLAEDPKGLKITLMEHQKHALAWMDWREHQKPRGGILADDMGLGKTLTMISMVLAHKNREEDKNQDEDNSTDDEEKENQGWSTKNRRDYYNGGTLVVCPATLMRQWENEVESKVMRHRLSVCVHHGTNRDTKPRHLATYDIVVTTYNIASREAKTQGALFSINWKRIILDEAHVVRNYKSQSSLAVCGLRGRFRWVLTGTPIQNKEMDMYALLKFLKCSPFDDLSHWKKWIDNKSAGGQQRLNTLIKSLMLRRTKALLQKQGSLMCLPVRECELIEVNLDKDEMNVYQKIMTYSKTLFAQFLYQRAEKNNDMYFSEQGQRPTFMQTKDPNGAYFKMHQKFSKMHHGGKEIKSHEILVLLLRLRQICCHPGLIHAMLEDEDEGAPSDSDSAEPEIDLLEQLNKLAISDESGPGTQLTDSLNEEGQHQAISKASAKVLQRSNPVFDLNRPSSKMNMVLKICMDKILNSSDKGIIISQWTSVLNILKTHLESKGVRTLSLNGTIPVKNRQNIVTEFNDANTKPKILLLSLTAGGVGLNLVGANHLLLIDLHWNPQLEAQAQDRIYRVGQKKPVYIYKFMCKDTVEERIKALQDQKLSIATGVLTGVKASEGSKLTIDDLKGLFGL